MWDSFYGVNYLTTKITKGTKRNNIFKMNILDLILTIKGLNFRKYL